MPATKPGPDGTSEAPVRKRRGFPVLPTVMVLITIPFLIGFGVWQLQRMHWKDALLAELQHNSGLPLASLDASAGTDGLMFRRLKLDLACSPSHSFLAGRNMKGQSGYSTIYRCHSGSLALDVNAGWAPRVPEAAPPPPSGARIGVLAPASPADPDVRGFILESAQPPLVPSAVPTVDSIPNNHLSYAIQWFSFAAILAVIYGLWLRRWLAQRGPEA